MGTTDVVNPFNFLVVQKGRICTPEHSLTLLAPITDAEIKDAIFSIPRHKAPGPDGYSSVFFKDSWHIIRTEICAAIHNFFRSGKLLKQLNQTLITLIPKIEMPPNVTHLRPIACCNILYKAISKLLCTRLAAVLPHINSENQGGFIHGWSIIENILMNSTKSNIYFNGVKNSIKEDIMRISGFTEGTLPFKYLGVPINAGRLNKKDSQALIDKVVERIRGFGNRKLSYAERLVLIQSVLTSLYTYWANIFLIPKGVLKTVDNICRNFLWDGNPECLRAPPIAWEKVWCPKSEEGLGIRDSNAWNVAAIGKLVWWIYTKPDTLWVKDKMQVGFRDEDWIDKGYKECQYSKMIVAGVAQFLQLQVLTCNILEWVQ
ncbi:uncharacterized protein LOC141617698 [Silene latifolia]|uniref:uncharacterized protein LOC141617698 n=1 Tax=Silene latifolia TaxID=37657 RepID=UPI003D77B5DD